MTDDLFKSLRTAANPLYPYIERSYGHHVDPSLDDAANAARLDRLQILFGHGRAAFMARHPYEQHWCGYVLVRKDDWFRIETMARRALRVSYAAASTKFTTWMHPNEHGRLTIEHQLAFGPDPDFWIGFDTLRLKTDERISDDEALAELNSFATTLYGLIDGNLTVRG